MKFKVGDKVKLRENSPYYYQAKEKIGTVYSIDDKNNYDYYINVKWDNNGIKDYRKEDLLLIEQKIEYDIY